MERIQVSDKYSFLDLKAEDFISLSIKQRKKWYLKNYPIFASRLRIGKVIKFLNSPSHLPLHIDFIRWYLIDLLSGKMRRFWGIYQFVALPDSVK